MLLKFSDLFDGLGTGGLAYGARCQALSGQDIEIRGWLSIAHDGTKTAMLVSEPGACPDCSPAPVAAIVLPGFQAGKKAGGAVVLRGRLAYGLAVNNGTASMLRLERARIATGLWV